MELGWWVQGAFSWNLVVNTNINVEACGLVMDWKILSKEELKNLDIFGDS